MPLKKLKIVSVILFVFLLSNCARVNIKNTEWCTDLGEEGATCFNTLNDNNREIHKEEWDRERFGMLCTSADDFSEWRAVILKLCRYAGKRCTYEDKLKIQAYLNKFDRHIEMTNKKFDNDKLSRFDN